MDSSTTPQLDYDTKEIKKLKKFIQHFDKWTLCFKKRSNNAWLIILVLIDAFFLVSEGIFGPYLIFYNFPNDVYVSPAVYNTIFGVLRMGWTTWYIIFWVKNIGGTNENENDYPWVIIANNLEMSNNNNSNNNNNQSNSNRFVQFYENHDLFFLKLNYWKSLVFIYSIILVGGVASMLLEPSDWTSWVYIWGKIDYLLTWISAGYLFTILYEVVAFSLLISLINVRHLEYLLNNMIEKYDSSSRHELDIDVFYDNFYCLYRKYYKSHDKTMRTISHAVIIMGIFNTIFVWRIISLCLWFTNTEREFGLYITLGIIAILSAVPFLYFLGEITRLFTKFQMRFNKFLIKNFSRNGHKMKLLLEISPFYSYLLIDWKFIKVRETQIRVSYANVASSIMYLIIFRLITYLVITQGVL